MQRIPFSPKELIPRGKTPAFAGRLGQDILDSPITMAENFMTLKLTNNDQPLWVPTTEDYFFSGPADSFLEDNIARFKGGKDYFGVEWMFMPIAGAACVKPGRPFMDNVNDWEKLLKFPDVNAYPWEKMERGGEERALAFYVLNGFFERLISLMDFQYAAMALVDEDQTSAIKALFDRLADFYIELIDKAVAYWPVDMLEIHDDWGSQRSSFFSLDIVMELIVPSLKKVITHSHEKGLLVEIHSCGKTEKLVPGYIEAGGDWWSGQYMNDFEMLVAKYGNQIRFAPFPRFLPEDAPDEEVYKAAEEFVDKFVGLDKPKVIASMCDAHPKMKTALYEVSRKKLNPAGVKA